MRIERKCSMSFDHMQSLTMLYMPLMSKNAKCLYDVLYSYQNAEIQISELCSLLDWNAAQFEKMRDVLIQYQLIRVFKDVNEDLVLVGLPLLPSEFLCHEIYSRLYLNAMGAKQFDKMKQLYCQNHVSGLEEVHSVLDVSVLDAWSESKEIAYEKVKPKSDVVYDFDFATFLKGFDRIFPARLRTKENLDKIAQLATIHGISAMDMRKYVQRSTNPFTYEFDIEKLTGFVLANRKDVKLPEKDPYSMSPVKFLQAKQNGVPVIRSDRVLIDRLCTEFKLPIEVVNTLIEYTLNLTNQQFSKNYVEKVAANWVRLKVDSRQKALEIIRADKPEKKQDLPEWYKDTRQEKVSEDVMNEALALQKQLMGGDD